MNEKKTAKKTAALFLGLALTVGGVGCNNFIVTDSRKDLDQTVATVDISASIANEFGADVANGVKTIVNDLSADISKRDLVAYFLSTGYQYVESYGYTYEDTFTMLMDGLVSREIMIQYAIAYYLKNGGLSASGCEAYRAEQLANASAKEKALHNANPEVLTLKYFLTEGGANAEDYDRAVYNLKKSLNSSLDSLEQGYIKAETEEHNHDTARTLPTGVDTEKEDYFGNPDEYNVYTGRNTLDSCRGYEKLDGSTTSTRKKAYNAFLANLQGYNMISSSGETEDTSTVTELNYYYVELSSTLGQALINKYFEVLEEDATAALTEEYVSAKYKEILESQEKSYKASHSDFETAMDSVSDTSYLLYGLDGFGYVYNILLPFSTSQTVKYNRAKNNKANTQDDLYNVRKQILTEVAGKDQRGSWISSHEHANYSYQKPDAEEYYFFTEQLDEVARKSILGEDSQPSTKYETLKQYAGTYAYDGSVDKTDADEWKTTPREVKIDGAGGFIEIFEKHINDTVGKTVAAKDTAWTSTYNETKYEDKIEKGDYSQFTYYVGKTDFGTATAEELRKDYFTPGTDMYNAISAVNELMFAYSTDTGCLNTYFGYAVSPYGTDFVKEFEYAAQYVVAKGAGTYAVCATDYGWHIVYASFVYDGGEVYGAEGNGYVAAEATVEGTFSNMFFEAIKTSAVQNHSTEKQNEVLNGYNNKNSVKRFVERYQDLLDMDN